MDIPVVVTEQYPKGKNQVFSACRKRKGLMVWLECILAFGPTVAELDVSDAAVVIPKTKFSMYLPEVVSVLEKNKTKSVLLLGIEVKTEQIT